MIEPTIAVSHVEMSKNSSSGSASKSTPARKPPRIAPTTPMIVVTIHPPGSAPGMSALAIAPGEESQDDERDDPMTFLSSNSSSDNALRAVDRNANAL